MLNTSLAQKAEAYLGGALNIAGFKVVSVEPIAGAGLSRQVFKLVTQSADTAAECAYILLLEQPASLVEQNRPAEYAILRALSGNPLVKVAQACWMEPDPLPLGAPFLLTGFLPGTAKPQTLLEPEFRARGGDIIKASFATLGSVAALDVASLGLGSTMPTPHLKDIWHLELDRWLTVLHDGAGDNFVVTQAAIRRLRAAHPPAPHKLSVVHGDYRLGNYLFDAHGLTGVIDWEMVHLGDAMEDLAWSLMANWEFSALPGRVGGFLNREEAVAAWERTSGTSVDEASLAWWTLLCHVKAVAIWATARALVRSGQDKSALMALVAWGMVEKQEALLADLLHEDRAMTPPPGLLLSIASESLHHVLQQQPDLSPLLGPLAALVATVAADVDTYVSDRMERAEQIKSILRHARERVSGAVAPVLDHALALTLTRPEQFSAPGVDAYLSNLKSALIAVHASLEGSERGSEDKRIIEQIWSFAKQEVRQVSRGIPSLM